MPPPVHGAAMMGKYIHDSQVINNAFDSHYINLTTATDLSNIGKFSLKKIWSFLKLLHLIYRTVREFRPQLVYVTPNACGIAFYKDFIVVEMLKMMGCKVVVHYHNKGVSRRQDKMLDNFLYKIFFLVSIVSIKALLSDFFINTSTSQPYTLTCTSSDCTVKYVKALDTRTWQICFSPITRNLTLTIGFEQ